MSKEKPKQDPSLLNDLELFQQAQLEQQEDFIERNEEVLRGFPGGNEIVDKAIDELKVRRGMLNPIKTKVVQNLSIGYDPNRKDDPQNDMAVVAFRKVDAVAEDIESPYKIAFPELLDEMVKYNYPNTKVVYEKPIAPVGQDILTIRTLTGKKRDNAMAALYQATEAMMAAASPDCFYIPTNVASSKNGKNPVTVRNINKKTGKPQEFTTLVPNDLVKKYIRETKGHWLQNKVAFLNQSRHLPLPITVEFTFIRKSMHGFDVINACQLLADLMKTNGWIPDDESVYFIPRFNRVTYYHNKLAGVLIKVIK